VSGTSGRGADAGDSGAGALDGGAGATNAGAAAQAGGEGGGSPISCPHWTGDCTDEPGCETLLDSLEHCGACGVSAPNLEHTIAVCSDEAPSPPLCAQGFADCDLASYDCETSYDSLVANCLPIYTRGAVYGPASINPGESLLTPSGELYLAGDFWAPLDFDPGAGEDSIHPTGIADGFLTKFAADGSYRFTRRFASPAGSSAYVRSLALAPDGTLRVTGHFFGEVDLDPGDGVDVRVTTALNGTAFVAALSAEGEFLWSATLPATDRSYIVQASVDAVGNTWLAGNFSGELMAVPSALAPTNVGAFIGNLDAAGNLGWVRVITGGENCHAGGLGVVAEASGAVNALVNVSGPCELHGTDVPTLRITRETEVGVLFHFDEDGEWLSAGVFEPADPGSSGQLWSAESGAPGTLMTFGSMSGKTDFDPTDGVDFRGAARPAGFIARFDAGELRWMQGMTGTNPGPVVATPNGGALLGSFGLGADNLSILGFAPDSRATFHVGLDQKLELHSLAANAEEFVVVASYTDGADLDPSPGEDIMSGTGFAISRFAFANP
jgi:hypothetical protein